MIKIINIQETTKQSPIFIQNIYINIFIFIMTIYYIYKIIFLQGTLTNHYYIGKHCQHMTEKQLKLINTNNIQQYIIEHPDFDKYTGSGKVPICYFKKYKRILNETYNKIILDFSISEEENVIKEKNFVGDLYKTDPLCENLQPGGIYHELKEMSETTREKLSKSLKEYYKTHTQKWIGIKRSEETKKKLSKIVKEYYKTHTNVWLGKKHTDESKQKNRDAHIKLWQNQKYRDNISKSREEYFKTHIPHNKGTHLSDERKQHLSEIFKGRPNYKNRGINNWMYGKTPTNARKVYQYDKEWNYLNEFNSIMEAARFVNLKATSNIIKVCKNERNFAGGFRWSYVLNK